VRSVAEAEASFAAMRERIRFGIAMAAMIKMIATTISNSISEKPACLFLMRFEISLKDWTLNVSV
jgi:fructose-specific phosphotransferase system IIC component